MCNNFNRRFDNYYTSFPDAVHVIALLENPVDNDIESDKVETHNRHAETYVKEEFKKANAKMVQSKTRSTHSNEDGGNTEWYYTTLNVVIGVFEKAYKKFKGKGTKFEIYDNTIAKDTQAKLDSGKPIFEGKIVTFV